MKGIEMFQCDMCKKFFERFRCNSPDECDCPKCQGLCTCLFEQRMLVEDCRIACRDGLRTDEEADEVEKRARIACNKLGADFPEDVIYPFGKET